MLFEEVLLPVLVALLVVAFFSSVLFFLDVVFLELVVLTSFFSLTGESTFFSSTTVTLASFRSPLALASTNSNTLSVLFLIFFAYDSTLYISKIQAITNKITFVIISLCTSIPNIALM